MNNVSNQLKETLRFCLETATKGDLDIPVSAASLASSAQKMIDPDNKSPVLVEYSSNLNLRQMAMSLLRREYDPLAQSDDGQCQLFDTLQDRYPAHRDGEKLYVSRMQLTLDERQYNITRMRREIEGKQKHLDALIAETEKLFAEGYFKDEENAAIR